MKGDERIIESLNGLLSDELGAIHIGAEIPDQLRHDWDAEKRAIDRYNEAIRLALEVGDHGTRELLEAILRDEEEHIDWIEAQQDQIEHIGVQRYLVEQID